MGHERGPPLTAVLFTVAEVARLVQEEGPDIIPDPDGPARASNTGGLIVGVVLVSLWLVAGVVLFRRARRRP